MLLNRENLLQCLLDIQDKMMLAPDASNRIPVTSLADDFVEYLFEVSNKKNLYYCF